MLIGFDLDDTLYKERDYVASGHRAVADAVGAATSVEASIALEVMTAAKDPFDALYNFLKTKGEKEWTVSRMVQIYRNHAPALEPDRRLNGLLADLRSRGHRLVIITDGRSDRQRAKINALGLETSVDGIYVSEEVGGDKISGRGFDKAVRDYPCAERIYIGDNPAKDFRYAALSGWRTVMVADTARINIHPQSDGFPARTVIFSLEEYIGTLLR